PQPLRLVQTFVNTADREHEREWLQTVDDLRRWLTERDLLRPPAARLVLTDLERAREVREALRELIRRNEPSEVLEQAARDAQLTLRFDGARTHLVPEARGVGGALGSILSVVHFAMH